MRPIAIAAALLFVSSVHAEEPTPATPNAAIEAPASKTGAEKPRWKDVAREKLKAFLAEQPGSKPAPTPKPAANPFSGG